MSANDLLRHLKKNENLEKPSIAMHYSPEALKMSTEIGKLQPWLQRYNDYNYERCIADFSSYLVRFIRWGGIESLMTSSSPHKSDVL